MAEFSKQFSREIVENPAGILFFKNLDRNSFALEAIEHKHKPRRPPLGSCQHFTAVIIAYFISSSRCYPDHLFHCQPEIIPCNYLHLLGQAHSEKNRREKSAAYYDNIYASRSF